jgi:hypothetical protein
MPDIVGYASKLQNRWTIKDQVAVYRPCAAFKGQALQRQPWDPVEPDLHQHTSRWPDRNGHRSTHLKQR